MKRRATLMSLALSAVVAPLAMGSIPASAAEDNAPVTRIVAGGRLTSTVPLETTWSSADGCGVLQKKVGTGPWRSVQDAVSGSGRATTAAAPGVRLRFRVVAGGCNGQPSTTTYGPSFVPRVQDNGSRGTFSVRRVVVGSAYYGGSTVQVPECGGDFRQTYTGYGFAYVHSGGPWDGIFDIWVDGVFTAANSMEAGIRYYRQIDFTIDSGNTVQTHLVELMGDGDDLCDLDAIIVLAPVR